MANRQHNLGEFRLHVFVVVFNQATNASNSHCKYEHLSTVTETLGHFAHNTELTVSFSSMFISLLYLHISYAIVQYHQKVSNFLSVNEYS